MINYISELVLFFIIGITFLGIYNIRQDINSYYKVPDGMKEWNDIRYNNGFIVLHWTEMEKWQNASAKEKQTLLNYQQKLIKEGLIKIVREDGERRLVTNYNYKQVKNDRQAKNYDVRGLTCCV